MQGMQIDRMFVERGVSGSKPLKNDGIALHMIDLGGDVTGNGISKLVFTILSAVAEGELVAEESPQAASAAWSPCGRLANRSASSPTP